MSPSSNAARAAARQAARTAAQAAKLARLRSVVRQGVCQSWCSVCRLSSGRRHRVFEEVAQDVFLAISGEA